MAGKGKGKKSELGEAIERLQVYESARKRTLEGNQYVRRCASPLDKATEHGTGIVWQNNVKQP